ncbi:MAG: CarD family transcriptional regulator [Corynebacterium sp.]|nr:CarD family transcriptional regulator [Corynebacterium sp.]
MEFQVGDTVVYPHHGAAVVEAIEHREMNGETLEFLVLQIHQSDLVVRVPAKNAELVGVRDVVDDAGLQTVFGFLRETDVEEAGNWSRRFKANQERLASGDVNKVAEVVRDLWRRDQGKGLSAGEKRMMAKARQVLVGELALAEIKDKEQSESLLKEIQETIERHRADNEIAPEVKPEDLDLDNLSFED